MGDLNAKIEIVQIDAEAWRENLSELAHNQVFGTHKPKEWDRIDYALLAVKDGKPIAYVTVRETDNETVYWQFGGGFFWARKSIWMVRTLDAMLAWQSQHSQRMHTLVENTNVTMLKLYIDRGLLISGVRMFRGAVLVELGIDFSG